MVTIGDLGSYAVGDGTYGYTCTIRSAFNPKSLGTCSVGNPIYPSTGNKLLLEHDYQAATLSFSRWYNSAVLGVYRTIGSKWRHTFYRSLAVIGGSGWKALLFRENGSIIEFRLQASVWLPDADIIDHLTELKDTNGVRTGWRYTVADDDSIETYSVSGKLLFITDRAGRTQTLAYNLPVVSGGDDDPETLDTVTDDTGRQLVFTYDAYKRIATVTDPVGGIRTYSYDAQSNLASVSYPDGTGKIYHYENTGFPHALTGITDENGSRFATYSYDAQGRATSTEHAGGAERVSLAYNADGTTTVTDALGTARTLNFQTILGVVKSAGQSQPGGSGCGASASALSYDANGNVASRTDFNGNRTNYSYDLTRNLETSRTEGLTTTGATTSATRTITTVWHPTFRLPVQITNANQQTTYAYNSQGDITQKTVKDTTTNTTRSWNTAYTYSAVPGVLLQKVEDGPRTDVSDLTTYDYYPADAACQGGQLSCRGQLKQITDALGHITQLTRYSANGQLEQLTDPNGLVMTMTYDQRQRLTSLDSGGETTTYTYDPAGQVTRVTRPDGAYLAYTYDPAHRLIKTQDDQGNTLSYTLDAMGNRIKEEAHDPGGQLARSQSRVYDALSRLQNLVQAQ
jgi:YD repeat-containing protein